MLQSHGGPDARPVPPGVARIPRESGSHLHCCQPFCRLPRCCFSCDETSAFAAAAPARLGQLSERQWGDEMRSETWKIQDCPSAAMCSPPPAPPDYSASTLIAASFATDCTQESHASHTRPLPHAPGSASSSLCSSFSGGPA